MSLDIMEIAIYLTGFFLNIASLSLCCRKNYWNTLTNIKYLIVAQALFSLLVIWSSFQLMVVSWSPTFFCTIAPLSMMFFLSLAIFNLTILVIVTHAQITREWQLRFSLAKMMLCLVMIGIFSLAFLSPFLLTAAVGRPMVQYKDSSCNYSMVSKSSIRLTSGKTFPINKVNITSYASFYIILQFMVPVTIIINRVLQLLWFYSLRDKTEKKEGVLQTKPRVPSRVAVEALINIFSFVIFIYLSILIYRNITKAKQLDFFNDVFRILLKVFFVSVFCGFPLMMGEMINTSCQEPKEQEHGNHGKLVEKITEETHENMALMHD